MCATLPNVDGVLCPVLVGRSAELAALTGLVAEATDGRGGLAVLVGEAGVGKSRLVREAAGIAADRGLLVLAGRSVPEASPLPFRPLSEALLVASRGQPPPDAPELAGFGAQLGRLVPDWGTPAAPGAADGSPVLIGEAVVRLLRVLGGAAGCLLVLEDLHWADPETLAVVDYLGDTLTAERVLCLATTRTERPSRSADLLDRLRSRRVATVLPLAPLPDSECTQMVRACLAGADVDGAVPGFVTEHSDGLPFLVEELLAGLVSSGALVRTNGGWRAEVRPTPSIPASFAESLRTRLKALDSDARQVLAAAAVLGRRFDWDLLPGVAAVDAATAVVSLRRAVDGQLVTVDGQRFRFRHALTREAVLAELLPPERSALSARALVAVQRAHPGLPGPWCELAAELAEAAGDRESAAAFTVESARRACRARRAGQCGADGRTRPAAGSGRVGGRGRRRRGAGHDPRARREARAGAGDRARAAEDVRRAGRTGRPAGGAPAAPRSGRARRR